MKGVINMQKPRIFIANLFMVGLVLFIANCGGGAGDTQETTIPSLTTFQDLPSLNFATIDTSSSYFTGVASIGARSVEKALTNTGSFSRPGCEIQNLKNELLQAGVIAEGFLCLYKIGEQYYPSDLVVPTNSFNYYTIVESGGTLVSRIGYYPNGFGNVTPNEAVLVVDECTVADDGTTSRSAELRVTSASVSSNLVGAGYYIYLIEDWTASDWVGTESDESFSELGIIELDTRGAAWSASSRFTLTSSAWGTEYGSAILTYDTATGNNTLSGFYHDSSDDGTFDLRMSAAFGPSASLPAGLSVGGSAHLIGADSGGEGESFSFDDIEAFAFQDSASIPAVVLASDTNDTSEYPFYTEMVALGNPPTASEPTISYQDEWDCTSEGDTSVQIDLRPADISAAVRECEAEEDALYQLEDSCAALDQNEY